MAERLSPVSLAACALATAILVCVSADPVEVPGGVWVAGAIGAAMIFTLGALVLFERRRSGARRHSGRLGFTRWSGNDTPWWRSPASAGPALVVAMILVRALGVFGHPAGIVLFAALAAVGTGLAIRASEVQDPIDGRDPDAPPLLSARAKDAADTGALDPDVLEMVALQTRNGERNIGWCARVLGVSENNVRERIILGRRWPEVPATDPHGPSAAGWDRLTDEGRTVLVGA